MLQHRFAYLRSSHARWCVKAEFKHHRGGGVERTFSRPAWTHSKRTPWARRSTDTLAGLSVHMRVVGAPALRTGMRTSSALCGATARMARRKCKVLREEPGKSLHRFTETETEDALLGINGERAAQSRKAKQSWAPNIVAGTANIHVLRSSPHANTCAGLVACIHALIAAHA